MRLYNTMSRAKEVFEPRGDSVTMYVCGVTPYDTTHLGHARTYVAFDVLQRYLTFLGLTVRYVQNVTDVDDPLLARAKELGTDYRALAEQHIRSFLVDLEELNVHRPAVYVRATEAVPHMLPIIRTLIESQMAYVNDGNVYFRASRFPGFGAMARLDRAGMLEALRDIGESPDDPGKEEPLDFRLWQAARPGEPTWESPWGPGRPGWHIECSTMALRHLGTQIDIHGGGADLIFPHHCCEIAQSESATGRSPFVRYWAHVGLVAMDGEKMSKSRGNLAFVRDLLPIHGADAVRHYLLGYPYREPFEYFEWDLAAAAGRWERIRAACEGPTDGSLTGNGRRLRDGALAALDDDLSTPLAVASISELSEVVRRDQMGGDRAALRELLGLLGFRIGA
ncbi:MAG: cysteine--tRNA ligase [Chloroflexi bacterium]|nr:cysteine--tRNA ligase [Chloroflexota bacterium]